VHEISLSAFLRSTTSHAEAEPAPVNAVAPDQALCLVIFERPSIPLDSASP
jgi:hypothetical protein